MLWWQRGSRHDSRFTFASDICVPWQPQSYKGTHFGSSLKMVLVLAKMSSSFVFSPSVTLSLLIFGHTPLLRKVHCLKYIYIAPPAPIHQVLPFTTRSCLTLPAHPHQTRPPHPLVPPQPAGPSSGYWLAVLAVQGSCSLLWMVVSAIWRWRAGENVKNSSPNTPLS